MDRTIQSLKTKWKNVKEKCRRRDKIAKSSQTKTGGGSLSTSERRIIESEVYMDVVRRLGISAKGNDPRHDSDSIGKAVLPPTPRLRAMQSQPSTSTAMQSQPSISTAMQSQPSTSSAMRSQPSILTAADVSMDSVASLSEHSDDSPDNQVVAPTHFLRSAVQSQPRSLTTSDGDIITSLRTCSSETTIVHIDENAQSSFDTSDNMLIDESSNQSSTFVPVSTAKVARKLQTELAEHLALQKSNQDLQRRYMEIQIDRANIERERDRFQKELAEVELAKSKKLMEIEIEKQQRLTEAEIKRQEMLFEVEKNKQQMLADIEVEAHKKKYQ